MARTYEVRIPIAGHVVCEVTADTEEEAIAKAFDEYDPRDVEWETVEAFNRGNVCYCPQPWEVEASDIGEAD